jgi:hypothetical protein
MWNAEAAENAEKQKYRSAGAKWDVVQAAADLQPLVKNISAVSACSAFITLSG